jgi:metal-responsive CopG/Arc/MetJ family transcriptional regulator
MAKGVKGSGGSKKRVMIYISQENISKLDKIYKQEGIRRSENLGRTDIINEAIDQYVQRYEKRNKI